VKVHVEVPEVAVAVRVTLVQEAERPVEGVMTLVKATVPVKPFTATTPTLSLPEAPALKLIVVEVGVRVKSATAAGLTVKGSQALGAPLLLLSPL